MLGDIRFALRLLARDRGFTITALLTLTVCISANTAIFSLVRSVLLRPLPVPEPDRLVLVMNSYPRAGAERAGTAVPDYFDRLAAMPSLAEQAILRRESVTVGGADGAVQVPSVRATPSFFRLVRLEPEAGRIFHDEEGEPGADAQVILSHAFWQREFAGDPDVVGRSVRVNGVPRTVVGVAPVRFAFIWSDVELFLPAAFTPEDKGNDGRHSNNWQMIGRLAPGAALSTAQAEVDALNAANNARFPEWRQILTDAGFHTRVVNLQDDLVRDVRAVLYLLWGGVLFVLVIGAVNLANLVMIRATARAREMATRHAIGAGITRLGRQLVTETVLLAFAGGAAGVAIGAAALRWVSSLGLDQIPRSHEIAVDLPAVAIMMTLAVATGVALALPPILRLGRANLALDLREDGRSGTAGRRTRLLQRTLATSQVAIAFVLVFGAGLLLASFRAVLDRDLGFDPGPVHTAALSLPSTAYPDGAARQTFVARALDAIRAIPGVEAAGVTSVLPFTGSTDDSVVLAEGYEMAPGESLISPTMTVVSPGYFESLGIRLVAGRWFGPGDVTGQTPNVIIDERLARKWWPGQDPIGRRLYFPTDLQNITAITPDTVLMNVIGVVGTVEMSDPLMGLSPIGAYYLPYSATAGQTRSQITLTVRAPAAPEGFMAGLRAAVTALDPDLPLFQVRSLSEWIDRALAGRRLPVYLALVFGGVGMLLSAVGIYGVLAYGVAARRRELGVRLALGGSAAQIFRLVLADGLRIICAGLVIGGAGAWLAGRAIESQLYEVSPLDSGVILATALVLSAVAVAASLIPSWRAARIEPATVLSR